MEIYNEFLNNFFNTLCSTFPITIVVSLTFILIKFTIALFNESPELAISIGTGASIGFMLMFLL